MKNVHERERESRLLQALNLFSDPEVLKARPAGLSKDDFLRLALVNSVATSIRLAKDYFDTLLYAGKIQVTPGSEVSGEILFSPSQVVRASSISDQSLSEKEKSEIAWLNQVK